MSILSGGKGAIDGALSALGKPRLANIEKAAELIARDNGGINRHRPVEDHKRELREYLAKGESDGPWYFAHLADVDAWIGGLSDVQLETVCCGEQSEQQAALRGSPPGTDELLNAIFEEVC